MANAAVLETNDLNYLNSTMKLTGEETRQLKRLLKLKSTKSSDEKYSEILEGPSTILDGFLYHGDLGDAVNAKTLRKLDIRNIVDVCPLELPTDIKESFDVLWISVNDLDTVDIRQYFDQTNQYLHGCRAKNEKVLVHCQAGISRSSTIILAYLLRHHYNTVYEAFSYLLDRRNIAEPNTGFLLQLIRYEKELSRKQLTQTASQREPLVSTKEVPPKKRKQNIVTAKKNS